MDFDKLCESFRATGGKEFPHPIYRIKTKSFEFKGEDGPECETNDRPPVLHVTVFNDMNVDQDIVVAGSVTFEVVGQYGSHWLRAQIYAVKGDEALGLLPCAKKTMAAVWATYCTCVTT